MTRPDLFGELRRRLDVRDLAAAEGLSRRGRHLDCPACAKRLKAMSRDGEGWFCVACDARGDAVDLIAAVRRLDHATATRAACALAGVDLDDARRDRPAPPPRPPAPSAPPPTAEDLAARLRAVRVAADHYRVMAAADDLDDGRDEWAAREHVAGVCGRRDAAALLERAATARNYLAGRLGGWPTGQASAVLGAAPSRRSGLRELLEDLDGDEGVRAAIRAGILRDDGDELLAGRVVYVWTDAAGVPVYLTGRAVPGLADDRAPKVLALPVAGAGADPARGVPRPGVPFGLHLARATPGRLLIVEGETAALAALCRGRAAVATGGVSRTRADDVRRALGERVREAVVFFDVETDGARQQATDARAANLAADLGCGWIPSSTRRAAA